MKTTIMLGVSLLLLFLALRLPAEEREGASSSLGVTGSTEVTSPEEPPYGHSYALDHPQEESRAQTGGYGFFQVSTAFPLIQPLNRALNDIGYGTFSNTGFGLGGMGMGVIQNIVVGGEGGWIFGDRRDLGRGIRGSWGGGYGMFHLGYAVAYGRRIMLYPLLGFGGGSFTIDLVPQQRTTTQFSEILLNPRQGGVITSSGMLLGVSLAVQYALSRDPTSGWVIAFRIGYLYSPLPWEMQLFSTPLSGTPRFRGLSGPFLLVGIGGGEARKLL